MGRKGNEWEERVYRGKVIRGGFEQRAMMCSSVMQACVIVKLIILHAN